MMFLMGEEGKPPLQMSLPQAGLHAGARGRGRLAARALPARRSTDSGQHIVVNMQACIVWTLMNEQAMPILHGDHLSRTGVFVGSTGARRKMVYDARTGTSRSLIAGGTAFGNSTKALIEWMGEKGFGADWMRTKDWMSLGAGHVHEADRAGLATRSTTSKNAIQRFFMTMTKREIYAQA